MIGKKRQNSVLVSVEFMQYRNIFKKTMSQVLKLWHPVDALMVGIEFLN